MYMSVSGWNTNRWSQKTMLETIYEVCDGFTDVLVCFVRALRNSCPNGGSECPYTPKAGYLCSWGYTCSFLCCHFDLVIAVWKADTEEKWCIPEYLFHCKQPKRCMMLLKTVLFTRLTLMHMQNDSQSLYLPLTVLKALSCEIMLRVDHRCMTQPT